MSIHAECSPGHENLDHLPHNSGMSSHLVGFGLCFLIPRPAALKLLALYGETMTSKRLRFGVANSDCVTR